MFGCGFGRLVKALHVYATATVLRVDVEFSLVGKPGEQLGQYDRENGPSGTATG